MIKSILVLAALSVAPVAYAQSPAPAAAGPICPAGMSYAAIRHSVVLPGKWATFEKAVADHQAWYASHDNRTKTVIARVLAPRGSGGVLVDTDAVTITHYDNKMPPAHDAGWEAFTAEYKASSTIKEEIRVCMPAMAH